MTALPRAIRPPRDDFAPIATINTTPLVDVMLVLLIMFIIIVPVASHKVPLDLPQPGPAADPAPVHRLDIADGEARYEQVDRILADIARAGVARLGFVDNRRFEHAF